MGTSAAKLKIVFSDESKGVLTKAFEGALAKLEMATPSSQSAQVEANNHFDADFHQKLLRGEHLKRIA